MKILIFGLFVFFALFFVVIAYSCCVVAGRSDDTEEEYWKQNEEHCVICGKVISEGRMVCLQCERNLNKLMDSEKD